MLNYSAASKKCLCPSLPRTPQASSGGDKREQELERRVTLKNKGGDTVVDAGGAGVVVYVGIDINASFFVIL